jgi:predicted ATP-dependent serine protease
LWKDSVEGSGKFGGLTVADGAVDIQKLNDAALSIQNAYNSKDPKFVEQAIQLLKSSVSVQINQTLRAVRADQIKLPEQNFISSGTKWLDQMLGGGLRRKELILIAGTPHSGKTHLLSWLACQYCIEGLNVLHFNGEDIMGDIVKIYTTMLNKKEMGRVFFADASEYNFTLELVNNVIEAQKEEGHPPDVIVIDYMDLIKSPGEGQDWLEVSETTQDLRGMAARHNLIMMTASQMNYAGPNSGRGVARLYRGKVGKASHADILMMIDDVDGMSYFISMQKAKGRKLLEKDFTLSVDLGSMEITPTN